MKKNKLLGWTFIALATITSCNNDTEEIYTQENEIKLTSEITPSRVTSLDYQSTQIVKDQQVGVTITGAKSEHNNVAWSVGDKGALSNTGEAVYFGDGTTTITAYHPYKSAWKECTSYEFSVSTDQSTEENYRNSDLLWATATSSKTESAVPLVFKHKLAKINVTLTSEDIADLSNATISICGTNITTNFNRADGTLSAATANVVEIKAGVTTSAYTSSAIVIPQTIVSGTKLIKVEHNGKTFYYTLTADKELKSGYSHNYTLTVKEKKTEIDLGSDNITNWDDEDIEGDLNEEVTAMTVTLSSAGTLNQYITNENINSLTGLTIIGEINGDDVRLFRSIPNLNYLNLKSATIIEGGGCFLKYQDSFDGFSYPDGSGGLGQWITKDVYTKKIFY